MENTARLRVVVLLVLIGGALALSLWAVWPWPTGDWKGLALNFGTEMAGAVVTYALLELFIGRRERREARKADLIAQLGSRVKDVAVAAAEELERHGWLWDGLLQGAHLLQADLQEASLWGANLAGANLQGANLEAAELQKAFLWGVNLQGADLAGANLQGANLIKAKLQGASLWSANLQGTWLADANLQGADLADTKLQGANFDENTTLPDCKVDTWHPYGPLHRLQAS